MIKNIMLTAVMMMSATSVMSKTIDTTTIECSGLGWFKKDIYELHRIIEQESDGEYVLYYNVEQNGKLVVEEGRFTGSYIDSSISWQTDTHYYAILNAPRNQYKIDIAEKKWSRTKGDYSQDKVDEFCLITNKERTQNG